MFIRTIVGTNINVVYKKKERCAVWAYVGSLGRNGDFQDGGKYTNVFLCVLICNILVVNKCVYS